MLGPDAKTNTGGLEALVSGPQVAQDSNEGFIQRSWVKRVASAQVSTIPRRCVLLSL